MSVQKRKTSQGIRYRFDKILKGHRITSPAIFLTKKQAQEAERSAAIAYLQGQKIPLTSADTSETVVRFLNRRLEWIRQHRGSFHFESSKNLFARALKFAPEWINQHPSQITPKEVEAWANSWASDLVSRGKTRYDVNKALIALQATWNSPWGRRRGPRDYPVNPFSWVDRFPIEKKAKYIPSLEDAQKAIDAANGEGKVYLWLLAATGARPSEARTLKMVDVGDDYVILYTRKKSGGHLTPRRVPVPQALAIAMKGILTFSPENIYVFQQDRKPEPRVHRWAQNIQIKSCRDAGIRYFDLHSWRHFHASKLADEKELSLVQIQRRLGHESATTTDRYLHELKGV